MSTHSPGLGRLALVVAGIFLAGAGAGALVAWIAL